MHNQAPVQGNNTYKLLWDFDIHTDHLISARRPDLIITKETGGLGSWRTSGDYPNYYIIENGLNPEKSPGDLRRLAVTQTPVESHQLTLM